VIFGKANGKAPEARISEAFQELARPVIEVPAQCDLPKDVNINAASR
jgi:hypothetical protein